MKHTRGFTLIELVIYIGLLGIILAIMSQVFLATVGIKVESEGSNNIQQDVRFIMARMQYDIRRAKTVINPPIGETASTLALVITENGADTTYQYASLSGNMLLTVGSSSAQLNGSGTRLHTFSVTRIGNSLTFSDAKDTLQVGLRVQGAAEISAGQQDLEVRSTMGLR